MASKRIQKVPPAPITLARWMSPVQLFRWQAREPSLTVFRGGMQELKDLQKDPPTSCSAGEHEGF